MFARLVEDAAPTMLNSLRGEDGFGGALRLIDPASGSTLLIVLWESSAQAERSVGTEPGKSSVWDVTVRI